MSAQAASSTASAPDSLARAPRSSPAQRILVVILALEIALFSIIGTNFLTRGNGFEVLRSERRDRPSGRRAHAGDRERRHRPIGRVADGPFGRRLRRSGATRACPSASDRSSPRSLGAVAGSLNSLLITWGRIPAPDRDPGLVLALPRAGRGTHRWRRQLHQLPPARSCSWAKGICWMRSHATADLHPGGRRVLGLAAPDDHRPRVGGDRLLTRRVTPRRAAGRPARRPGLLAVGAGLQPRGRHLRGPPWASQGRAGTGYELLAITAVVLGGTSIFGGRGSIHGTLLGLFAIAVLQNGLRLADLPAELAGVLIGDPAAGGSLDWILQPPGPEAAAPHSSKRR